MVNFPFSDFIIQLVNKTRPMKLLFIELSKNHIHIKEINSGKTISKPATIPFSNDRLIIADFLAAETFFRESIDELAT